MKANVLIFPCGAENAIELHSAMKYCVNVNLVGASSADDHGRFVFENYAGGLPFIQDAAFIPKLNECIKKHAIDLVIPTHDTVSLFFAEKQGAINARCAVPGFDTALICRHKKMTYALFKEETFCPFLYSSSSVKKSDLPLFIKPDLGEGGKGIRIANEITDLPGASESGMLIVEYLPGEELTVDCFTDRKGLLRFIGPRIRSRVRNGISVRSSTVPLTGEITSIAGVINGKMKLRGLWFFQVKKDKAGQWKLLEVSVRTAGTMSLYRNLGVNLPLLTVYDYMDQDVDILQNNFELTVDRALFNRYESSLDFDRIYIDFDDTVTLKNKVNPFVMFFLYQMRNRGKHIVLLTRHSGDIRKTLSKFSIEASLFDRIIHIRADDDKATFIDGKEPSVFIDNAFAERANVKKKHGIPVFDVDAIQSLMSWKE